MLRSLPILTLLLAWFCGTFASFDVPQLWIRLQMFVSYTKIAPIEAALRMTWADDNLCTLSHATATEQASLPLTAGSSEEGAKIVLGLHPAGPIAEPQAASSRVSPPPASMPDLARAAPPSPPPRRA